MKEYKGILKAVGYDSPNKKFKEILGPAANNSLLNPKYVANNQASNNLTGGS